MKLRTHTLALPTDYVSELRNKAQRKKSRCFIEYFYDMEVGEHNSYGFYAKSWEVGKGTAHRWIKEFDEALEIFDSAREIRRKTHYKKATQEDVVSCCPKYDGTNGTNNVERTEHHQEPIISDIEKNNGTNGTNNVEQSFININNKENNSPFLDKEFMRFITEIKLVIKNVGKIETIYQSYLRVRDLVGLDVLSKVYREYSRETKDTNKVGLAKFMDDLMFMSYVKPVLKVTVESDTHIGTYDKDKELLITENTTMKLTHDRYSELNSFGSIEILKYVA